MCVLLLSWNYFVSHDKHIAVNVSASGGLRTLDPYLTSPCYKILAAPLVGRQGRIQIPGSDGGHARGSELPTCKIVNAEGETYNTKVSRGKLPPKTCRILCEKAETLKWYSDAWKAGTDASVLHESGVRKKADVSTPRHILVGLVTRPVCRTFDCIDDTADRKPLRQCGRTPECRACTEHSKYCRSPRIVTPRN